MSRHARKTFHLSTPPWSICWPICWPIICWLFPAEEKLGFEASESIFARYRAKRELWYKGNPDAQTNEAFRRAQKLPLRVTQGQRKHYTGRNYIIYDRKVRSGAQPHLWTDEEILAYQDFDERTEKQTEHSVMTEFAGNGNRFVNRGIGALLDIAAADIAKRADSAEGYSAGSLP
ncbi:hypothetical protein E4U30_007263 [Claviceps sp. LM220 group G6]|nr:hypothetical protein E4U30_007263 [Claviceps sp. LM220 group G6]